MNDAVPNNQVPVYILAGGKSSRFGSDKARAMINGRALILRAADQAGEHARVTAVAQSQDAHADLGLRTIADRISGRGPMGGLHAALQDSPADWLLLLSCDMLGVRRQWIDLLWAQRGDDVDAVVFRGAFFEPMPGFYRRTLCREVENRLAASDYSMQGLLSGGRTRSLPLPEGWSDVVQVNTRQSMARVGGTGCLES